MKQIFLGAFFISITLTFLAVLFGIPNPVIPNPVVSNPVVPNSVIRAEQAPDQIPSFRGDIMPVFFRAGCNAGTCHGSAQGKDGFMLSLFGYDPKGDYNRLVNEMVGRRINQAAPEQSLLLTKAIGAVPHTGGELFTKDSDHYKTLLRWIEAGAPDDEGEIAETIGVDLSQDTLIFDRGEKTAPLKVTARESDGSTREVTHLARYFSNNTSVATINENGKIQAVGPGDTNVFARFNRFTVGVEVIVLPQSGSFTWPNPPTNNFIDELVFARLKNLRIAPSKLCNEETFLRRITLDLAARTPTAQEYRSFMADTSPNKRSEKIEELLASDEFTDIWTTIWSEQLRVIGGSYAPPGTLVKAASAYQNWIHKQIGEGRPLNKFVAEMVASSGSNLRDPETNLYTMLVHRPEIDAKILAADFSQLFLGIQIQCAECHNHPFDRWTMDDFYSFTSFFTGIERINGSEPREQRIFYDTSVAPAKHLVDQRPMPARVLGGTESIPSGEDPRVSLANWLTAPDNELFRENIANRIWSQLMGRGIVEPVDDIRVSNPPSNAPLYKALGKRLAEADFDLRTLVRDICNSKVYQLSIAPNESNKLDTRQFSHRKIRRLRADVLIDAITDATDKKDRSYSNFALGTRAVQVYPLKQGDTARGAELDSFFHNFGMTPRKTVAATETKMEPTLPQILHLAVGKTISQDIGIVPKQLYSQKLQPEQLVEELYIRSLSRKPSGEELADMLTLVKESEPGPAVYEDIYWGLLNTTEFLFNH